MIAASGAEAEVFTLELAKEDFKFSSAHFTLFDASRGELLHGHNYRVTVRAHGRELDELELLVEVGRLKERIRAICAELDSRTLLPARSGVLEVAHRGEEVEVRFHSRRYVLPASDTLLLPVRNISIEALARLLWERLVDSLDDAVRRRIARLGVAVEETAGQRCWFEKDLAALEHRASSAG